MTFAKVAQSYVIYFYAVGIHFHTYMVIVKLTMQMMLHASFSTNDWKWLLWDLTWDYNNDYIVNTNVKTNSVKTEGNKNAKYIVFQNVV